MRGSPICKPRFRGHGLFTKVSGPRFANRGLVLRVANRGLGWMGGQDFPAEVWEPRFINEGVGAHDTSTEVLGPDLLTTIVCFAFLLGTIR